ncbi:MAG: DUF3021 domain-containing protein [Acutalibacteraceae bacterium]|nr:DUF3021 domain-containing protein [Acutalibacteraceae bacterium]
MFKEVLKRSVLSELGGLFISQLVGVIISLCIADGNYYPVVPSLVERMGSEIGAVIFQTICSLLYGAVFGGMSLIWELDNWSILKQTVIHFLVVSIVSLPIAYVTEWMEHSVSGAIIYFVLFAVIYVFIWFSQYMAVKKRINEVNKKLKETT